MKNSPRLHFILPALSLALLIGFSQTRAEAASKNSVKCNELIAEANSVRTTLAELTAQMTELQAEQTDVTIARSERGKATSRSLDTLTAQSFDLNATLGTLFAEIRTHKCRWD